MVLPEWINQTHPIQPIGHVLVCLPWRSMKVVPSLMWTPQKIWAQSYLTSLNILSCKNSNWDPKPCGEKVKGCALSITEAGDTTNGCVMVVSHHCEWRPISNGFIIFICTRVLPFCAQTRMIYLSTGIWCMGMSMWIVWQIRRNCLVCRVKAYVVQQSFHVVFAHGTSYFCRVQKNANQYDAIRPYDAIHRDVIVCRF